MEIIGSLVAKIIEFCPRIVLLKYKKYQSSIGLKKIPKLVIKIVLVTTVLTSSLKP